MYKVAVYKELPQVTTTLERLGLQVADLQEAAKANFLEQAACTANNAPTAPGFRGWDGSVRVLSERLILRGWIRKNIKNSPRIVSPDEKVAIMVATGDEATGNPTIMPKTRSHKGATTRTAIDNNGAQALLFAEDTIPHKVPVTSVGQSSESTWVLLIYSYIDQDIDKPQHYVLCELSLPAAMGTSGHITAWSERIILPEITIDPDDLTAETEEYALEQEIILQRKA